MYVYGLWLLFDFATKNLHLATIFYYLVDKCDLRILLISSPEISGNIFLYALYINLNGKNETFAVSLQLCVQ